MRLTISSASLLLLLVAGAACAQQPTTSEPTAAKSASKAPNASRAPELQWGPAPAIFPAGAEMAVLQGNPGGSELFTVRLRFPNGYRIPAHTHPTDEHVTVISGTFLVGMGPTFESDGMMRLKAGGFVSAPANHAHYAAAQGPTSARGRAKR